MNKILFAALILILTVLLNPFFETATAQADVYSSYNKLSAQQTKGQDYNITSYNGPSSTAVIAIHGGNIEKGTCNLAQSVAELTGSDLYTFQGIKSGKNNILHITSTKFDEPGAKILVAESKKTLSIHGCSGSGQTTYIGGLDKQLASRVKAELSNSGFKTAKPKSTLSGTSPSNICNKNASKKGVQLELTYAMRQALLKNQSLYNKYINALASAL